MIPGNRPEDEYFEHVCDDVLEELGQMKPGDILIVSCDYDDGHFVQLKDGQILRLGERIKK